MIGEVRFEAGGHSWVLCYSANALIAVEEALGIRIADIGDVLQGASIKELRTIFRCGFIDNHPEIDEATAGRLVTVAEMGQLVGRAMSAAFPPAQPGNGDARPLAPAAKPRGSKNTGHGLKPALALTPSGV